jgi:hypothetical protein
MGMETYVVDWGNRDEKKHFVDDDIREKERRRRPFHNNKGVKKLWRLIVDQVGKGLKVWTPSRIHIELDGEAIIWRNIYEWNNEW